MNKTLEHGVFGHHDVLHFKELQKAIRMENISIEIQIIVFCANLRFGDRVREQFMPKLLNRFHQRRPSEFTCQTNIEEIRLQLQ